MNLKGIGEFGFIRMVRDHFPTRNSSIVQGIGDDAAVLRTTPGRVNLITTDLLIEDVHFKRTCISMEHLGHKSLAVNLSDIAAMGGTPICAVISLAIPGDENVDSLLNFYHGMGTLAHTYHVELVGGDTSISCHGLNISITVLGEADPEHILYRHTARVGDSIYVTGYLGDSAYGLGITLHKWDSHSPLRDYFYTAHNLPHPYVSEGQFFAKSEMAHAMIDLSDGLSSDLGHICEESKVGARIYEQLIPFSMPLREEAMNNQVNSLSLALHGGEDYCLLVTGLPELEYYYKESLGKPLYRIGEIVSEPGIVLVDCAGKGNPLKPGGYDHFIMN